MYKVAQCWDDGVVNDCRVAEICRKYNAKATFNINPGINVRNSRLQRGCFDGFDVFRLSLAEMPSVYEGFQLASHTMTHPHPTQIIPEKFRCEAVDARHYIEDLRQTEARGFAWPYGEYNEACIDILREEGFLYGRTTQYASQLFPCPEPLTTPTQCHFLHPDFNAIRERAAQSGVFYFWGHSYEMKNDPQLWEYYENNIRALSADPEAQWTDVIDLFKIES